MGETEDAATRQQILNVAAAWGGKALGAIILAFLTFATGQFLSSRSALDKLSGSFETFAVDMKSQISQVQYGVKQQLDAFEASTKDRLNNYDRLHAEEQRRLNEIQTVLESQMLPRRTSPN
jgi:hypothetical protein